MREMTRLLFNKRFRKVFFMFLGFFVQFWWLGKIKKFINKEKVDSKYRAIYSFQASKFTTVAVEMGGLIIKLGQFISSRVDILPKEYTDILSELQDSVAPVNSEIILKRIEEEGSGTIEDVFTAINPEPVAAASLGQVHKAILKNGENVAVKVMRPGIEETVSLDLATLKVLIAFARRGTKIGKFVDLREVYQEFEEVIIEELDYIKEAKNIEKFRENFLGFPGVSVPNVYGELSTSKILVMEYIEGVKINEVDKLEELRVNKKKLASILFLSYLKQIMEDGFFHADPHPGNLLVKKDGTIAYIDFGMVGYVSDPMKESMFKLALAIYLKDAGGIVEAFDDLGFLRKKVDKSLLTKNVKVILANFLDGGFNFNNLNKDGFLEELREFLYQQPFQIPSRTTFLGKAIVTVFSICKGLDDNFDIISITKPYVEEMMKSDEVSAGKETVLEQVKNIFLKVIPASRKIFTVIDQLESGEIRIKPSKAFENNIIEHQAFQNRKIILALFGTGLLIAGAQIIYESHQIGMTMMVSGAIITLLQALRKSSTKGRRYRRHPFLKEKNEKGRSK
ncbi:AarF/UbiB family protein [Neobacillus sp. PS3-40]|uniref:ABC1 kinase family protein n=1 Tax=Neobacillus sp. PS3-40 TaxID=3070679 RepID=UPI0027DF7E0E|nr:AarF/UbiB family protein [Neobacillus sp. PS3-40]WML45789.1 AarF/UbiB family protein [Neobacillus sp. PS3-40]